MGNEDNETCPAEGSNRRIHDAVVTCCSDDVGKPIAGRVGLGGVGVQIIRPWSDSTNVHEVPYKTRKQFGTFDNGIEIANVGEFALDMERYFGDARLNGERGIPSAPARTIEAVQASGQPISKSSVDEVCVRDSEHELSTVKMICSDVLCPQSTAGRALNFRERIQFVFSDQFQEHWIAQSRARNEAYRAILCNMSDE
jgi:hypothetical protein